MKKRITSVLLALVMLLSLVPAMGTTALAAGTGTVNEYLYINREYKLDNGKYITQNAPNNQKDFNGKESSLPDADTYAALFNDTLYLNGDWDGSVGIYGAMSVKRWLTNPLNIVVMGNTTIKRLELWWNNTAKENSGVTIDLRNNATLDITYATHGDGMSAINAKYSKGDSTGWFGADVTVKGTGTLKTDAVAPNWHSDPFAKAGTFSITENVNLDTKLAHTGTTDYPFYVYSLDKFVIDTTGYVKIDTSGYADALMLPAVANRYDLKNASSITLTSSEKKTMFGDVNGGNSDFVQKFINSCCTGWNVAKSDNDAKPYTLTLTRKAELENPTLNVGGTSYAKDAVIPDHVVSDNASKKLSVSFDAGPQWFTNYYLKNKVNLNARVYIWKDGVFQSGFSIAQMTGGRTDGTLGFTLDVRNLDLEANKTYRVYVSVSPTMNGEYLAEPLTAQWTFKMTAEPVLKEITAVGLMQDFYLYEKDDSSINYPNIKISGTDQPYTIKETGSWAVNSPAPETYTRTVTLKANDGYKFTSETKVTAVNADGAKPVDKVESTFDETTGTLSVTITTYKRYTVDFLKPDGTGGMATQYVKKDGKAVAPENTHYTDSGKVFVGWKKTLDDSSEEALIPGNQTAEITENTKYYAVFEDAPDYSITLSKLLVEPKVAAGTDNTFYLTITNTGNAETGGLTVFFKMNSGDHFKFTNDVESVEDVEGSETYTPITTGVSLNSGASELTIPSIVVGKKVRIKLELSEETDIGDYGCAVQVKSADSSSTLKSNIVLVKTTVAKRFTINLYRSTDANPKNSNTWFVGDVVELDAVDESTLGALRAHETFTGWTANKSEIVFEDPTAMNTKFVVPYIDTSDDLAITANFVTATVNGIAITQMPTKTAYEAGESFDPAGIEVKLTYTDGTMEALPAGATLSYDPNTTDALATTNTSVKVSYTDSGSHTWDTYLPITVKAQDAATYTVSYDANGGTGSMTSDTATQGVSFILPPCTFTPPANKVFDKWQFGDDTSTYYQAGQSVTITDNTTVKAIWAEIPAGAVKVAPPAAAGPFTYDGTEKTGVSTGSNYGLTGTAKATNAGTYTAIASLSNSSYYWDDGTQQPKQIEWTINPASQAAPTDPLEMDSRTTDSITLKKISGAEYSMDGSYWQTSPEFTGLSSGTSYTFFARIPATSDGNYSASDAITATFSTLSGSSSSGTGSTTYTVKVLGSKNGSVTADRKTASAGTTVTLTVSPDKGYVLETLTVLDKSDKEIKMTAKNGKYTFTMPASSVEVEATFKAAKSGNPFVDVPSGAYYEDAVIWAVDKGITSGTDAAHFTPNGVCTRAQAVTFLWRAAGSPAPKSTTMPFTDVAKGSYYEQAVLWAVENGITKGTSDTTFSPSATCSRAQIVTFLWRSQKSPAAGSVNPFTDVKSDAYYADAVLWAVKESVTSGTTATTFSPNADCTRAQIVTFIYRALAE